MKLLVADDDIFFQTLLEGLLSPEYDLVIVQDGLEAWHELQRPPSPRLAILDWVMPGMSGPQICRKVRASQHLSSIYLILLTARNNESDIVAGLRSGADDYITKPPLPAELRARIKMGERVLALQDAVKASSTTNPTSGPETIYPGTLISGPPNLVEQNGRPADAGELTLARYANPSEYHIASGPRNQALVVYRTDRGEAHHSKH